MLLPLLVRRQHRRTALIVDNENERRHFGGLAQIDRPVREGIVAGVGFIYWPAAVVVAGLATVTLGVLSDDGG